VVEVVMISITVKRGREGERERIYITVEKERVVV
jgi:hypothetical protein